MSFIPNSNAIVINKHLALDFAISIDTDYKDGTYTDEDTDINECIAHMNELTAVNYSANVYFLIMNNTGVILSRNRSSLNIVFYYNTSIGCYLNPHYRFTHYNAYYRHLGNLGLLLSINCNKLLSDALYTIEKYPVVLSRLGSADMYRYTLLLCC